MAQSVEKEGCPQYGSVWKRRAAHNMAQSVEKEGCPQYGTECGEGGLPTVWHRVWRRRDAHSMGQGGEREGGLQYGSGWEEGGLHGSMGQSVGEGER